MKNIAAFFSSRIRLDRNELSGAFGDMGTVVPLIAGMVAVTGIDGGNAFVVFGLMQIATALAYGIPMPVQPLKAVAVIVITQKLAAPVLVGGGIAIGVLMLVISISGLVDRIGETIPRPVIRGIQAGLGIQLATLACKEYIPSGDASGLALAGIAVAVMILLRGNRKIPPAIPVILIGIIAGGFEYLRHGLPLTAVAPAAAGASLPAITDIIAGLILLAVPQIPLSLGNSIYATECMAGDLFPEKRIGRRKIALTYSLMNLAGPLLGGIPVCHGSGGMAGHHAFGARTGGSVAICGIFFITLGLVFGSEGTGVLALFPKSLLGVILLFESIAILDLARDQDPDRIDIATTVLVAFCAVALPYGYIAGMTAGIIVYYSARLMTAGQPFQALEAAVPDGARNDGMKRDARK
jgi:hypothetical protein